MSEAVPPRPSSTVAVTGEAALGAGGRRPRDSRSVPSDATVGWLASCRVNGSPSGSLPSAVTVELAPSSISGGLALT